MAGELENEKQYTYYSGQELYALKNYSPKEYQAFCEMRHNPGSVRKAARAIAEKRELNEDDIPQRLYNICLNFGIIRNTRTERIKLNQCLSKRISEDIFHFLITLPGADAMDEEMWLKTPELWAFVDFASYSAKKTKSGIDMVEEIRKNQALWCDKWVNSGKTVAAAKNLYTIPYKSVDDLQGYSRRVKEEALKYFFAPASQLFGVTENNYSEKKLKRAKAMMKSFPCGYISFINNIPISFLF